MKLGQVTRTLEAPPLDAGSRLPPAPSPCVQKLAESIQLLPSRKTPRSPPPRGSAGWGLDPVWCYPGTTALEPWFSGI